MISFTITDKSGRTLSGQTLEAFYISVRHAKPFSIGINCALGARDMRPYLADLARIAECYVSSYPNAGLPNAFGQYDELPAETARAGRDFATSGLVNIVGGCCGTTPDHISSDCAAVEGVKPRIEVEVRGRGPKSEDRSVLDPRPSDLGFTQLSGLEPLVIRPDSNFQMVGERTNVTGSARFARLIKAGNYAEATHVALDQVRGGANIIDVNMDEGMLDSEQAMTTFLNYIATEPEIARVPVMIDSSKWTVLEAGLKCVQGKGVVNSISLKEGEADFLEKARARPSLRRGGDRHGVRRDRPGRHGRAEGADLPARLQAADRAARASIPPDIIFDPNILAIATGLEEHNDYAVNYIEATRIIKATCPGVKISGGVSNLSFSFRGNDIVREAMHSAFLFHAIKAGMDMGIVNAGQLVVYEDIPKDLLEHVEDVIFNRRPDATERLVQFAETVKGAGKKREEDVAWRERDRREAARARARARDRRVHRAGHRRGAPEIRAAARHHRRAADGRHEDRRRPVRLRQDVPAAGGEERARDEEGGRLPRAVHGRRAQAGGSRPIPTPAARRAGSSWRRSRGTSTTSARTSSAWCSAATTTR